MFKWHSQLNISFCMDIELDSSGFQYVRSFQMLEKDKDDGISFFLLSHDSEQFWFINNLYTISDIMKQVHELATCIYQIRGHIKGRTLLPFPQVISGEIRTIMQFLKTV